MGTSDIMKTFKFVETLIFEYFIQMTPVLATRLWVNKSSEILETQKLCKQNFWVKKFKSNSLTFDSKSNWLKVQPLEIRGTNMLKLTEGLWEYSSVEWV